MINSKRSQEILSEFKGEEFKKYSHQGQYFYWDQVDGKLSLAYKFFDKALDRDDLNLVGGTFCRLMKNGNFKRCLNIKLREIDSYLRDDQLIPLFNSDNQYWDSLLSLIQGQFIHDVLLANFKISSNGHLVAKNIYATNVFQFFNREFIGKDALSLQLFEHEFIYFNQDNIEFNQNIFLMLEKFFERIFAEKIKLVAVKV